MYSSSKFNGKIKDGDKGGNLINIYNPLEKKEINLHAFWDSCLSLHERKYQMPLSTEDIEYTDVTAKSLMEKYPKKYFGEDAFNLDYNYWILNSFE